MRNENGGRPDLEEVAQRLASSSNDSAATGEQIRAAAESVVASIATLNCRPSRTINQLGA